MKNLLVYTNLDKKFDKETAILVKIQIDNSLSLGWKKNDIILITNFSYQYNGIKSIIVDGKLRCPFDKTSNKIPVITHLLNENFFDEKELYWYHDFDAYQNEIIIEKELELNADIGFTSYVYKDELNCGSFFFKKSSKDIFNLWNHNLRHRRKRSRMDEKIMRKLILTSQIEKHRYKIMDGRYNMTMRDIFYVYHKSKKPIKVIHFHPYYHDDRLPDTLLNTFMYGKNRLKKPIMSERLIKIFQQHGIV